MSALLESLLTRQQREDAERADLRDRYLDAIRRGAMDLDGNDDELITLPALPALPAQLEHTA
jgi:hypothetical protein